MGLLLHVNYEKHIKYICYRLMVSVFVSKNLLETEPRKSLEL